MTIYKNIWYNNQPRRNKYNNFFGINNNKLSIIKPSNIISCSDKDEEKCKVLNSKHGINEIMSTDDYGDLDLRGKQCKFSTSSSGVFNFLDLDMFKSCFLLLYKILEIGIFISLSYKIILLKPFLKRIIEWT